MDSSSPTVPPADSSATGVHDLAALLVVLGCPVAKSAEMAAQLEKRADQLAALKGTSREAALAHLLGLMKQGWAARDRGL